MQLFRPQQRTRRRLYAVMGVAITVVLTFVGWRLHADELSVVATTKVQNGQTKSAQASPIQAPAEGLHGPAADDRNTRLKTLLDQIANANAKGNYAIAVAEPNGRSAQVNGDKQFTSASIYKLFVAYAVLTQIDAGSLRWSDPINAGRDATTCFEAMIVQSDNDCAKAFGRQIGWQNVTNTMHKLGLAATHVEEEHHKTTANDLALFLSKLEGGSLVTTEHRTKLLDAMKRQTYRQGIPAGTGVTVANKVGFLDGLLHDAAIVYAPKGPYILVILSDGSTWSQLANAAKQIHAHMESSV